MKNRFLKFENVTFAYPGMAEPLLENVNAYFPEGGWTGIVGANGCGKTTLLKIASGELQPTVGKVSSFGRAYYVVQRTDNAPDDYEDFLYAYDPVAVECRYRLGIDEEWAGRWETLSHGERKRVQVGVALWHEPEVLALDEPTNHLDAKTREILLCAMLDFKGAGLVVSHDRAFLDALCSQCLFIFTPQAVMRPGGVTDGMAQDRREQAFQREKDSEAKDEARRLRAAAQARREVAEQAAAKNKAARSRKIPANDHDGREKRNLAKLTGKNAWAFSASAAIAKRAAKSEAARHAFNPRKEYEMGFWLNGGERSERNAVLALEAGKLALGDGRTLVFPELRVCSADRIAITGENGIGKSSLIRYLMPFVNVPPEKVLSIPQEITEEESAKIHAEVKTLGKAELGLVMTSVSRLGSRPGRLLQSGSPSPGEIRKILLAMGVNRGIHLLIMDEPTNHLDLPSIECLEEALAECPCAMILVSHDERFLAGLTTIRWHLEVVSEDTVELHVLS